MEVNNIFHPTRFFLLLKEEITTRYRTSLIALGAATIVLVFFALMPQDEDFHEIWFPILLFAGGFIFTSISFSKLKNKPSRQFYLQLPGSHFEKFSTKWLLTAIVYPAVLIVFYQVYAWVLQGLSSPEMELFTMNAFEPFSEDNVFYLKLYLVLQTIFLVGAVAFNRFAIFKTLFTLFVAGLAIGLVAFIAIRLGFAEYWQGFETVGPGPELNEGFQNWVEHSFAKIMENLFWWGLAPVALIIGFLKLKEKEV